jgi:hypothetical protein
VAIGPTFIAAGASYVDRIPRGEKPADLPWSRQGARLTIPPKLLFTTEEVIE